MAPPPVLGDGDEPLGTGVLGDIGGAGDGGLSGNVTAHCFTIGHFHRGLRGGGEDRRERDRIKRRDRERRLAAKRFRESQQIVAREQQEAAVARAKEWEAKRLASEAEREAKRAALQAKLDQEALEAMAREAARAARRAVRVEDRRREEAWAGQDQAEQDRLLGLAIQRANLEELVRMQAAAQAEAAKRDEEDIAVLLLAA